MKKPTQRLIAVLLLLTLTVLALMLAPVQADFGVNWTGQFYNTPDLTGAVVATATYASGINANWGTGAPTDGTGTTVGGVNTDGFSVRFTSTQTFADGTYTFTVTSDDGFRLYIDGVVIFDQFIARPLTTDTFNVVITGGNHALTVEYFDNTDNAVIQVQWNLAAEATLEATLTPVPVVKGSVVRVKGLAVRTGPYLGASLITVARPENVYDISARNTSEGLFTWYKITVGERTGWSSGRYLEITGDENIVPFEGSIFDQIDGVRELGIVAVPRSVMNFRVRPSVRVASLGQIPWGGETSLIGRTVQGGKDFWYQVRYNGQVGWIFAPFVGHSGGPIDLVPIR